MNRCIVLVLLVSTSSFAEDPFACVDPDVADAFLGVGHRDRPAYSTSLPDGFIDLDIPAGLTLVGSQIEPSMSTVIFKSNSGIEQAHSGAIAALRDAGWKEKTQEHASAQRGFQVAQRPASAVFCHDDQPGSVIVFTRNKADRTIVGFAHHSGSTPQSCSESVGAAPRHQPRDLMAELPRLVLPENAKSGSTSTGGSGDEVHTQVDVSGAPGRPELISHFGDQIRDQGWAFDTSWSGSYSSGTVWTLDSPDAGVLIGKLHVFGAGADPVRVRFSIIPVDPARTGQAGSWSSTTIRTN